MIYPYKELIAIPSGRTQGGPVTTDVIQYGALGDIRRFDQPGQRPLIQHRELLVEQGVLHLYALIYGAFRLTSMAR